MPESTAPTDAELRKIQLFRERVEDLRGKGLVRSGKTKITVNIAGVVPSVIEGLDEDHLASFVSVRRSLSFWPGHRRAPSSDRA